MSVIVTDVGLDAAASRLLRHAQCNELLPWFVNRTLASRDARMVENHLGTCLDCRREVEHLKILAAQIGSARPDSACDAALRRLHARMNARPRAAARLPWASAAVLVLVVGLVALLSTNAESSVAWLRNAGYSMLSQNRIDASTAATPHARLVFYDDITERQLRSLLLAVGAEVVEGPTPQGVYTIAFSGPTGARDFVQALSKLRYSRRVIFAEPAPATTKVSDVLEW